MPEVTLGDVIDLLFKLNGETDLDYVLCTSDEYQELEQRAERAAKLEKENDSLREALAEEYGARGGEARHYEEQIADLQSEVAEYERARKIYRNENDTFFEECLTEARETTNETPDSRERTG